MQPKTLKQGEPCPACGGALRRAQQPTDAERKGAADRDNWRPLPPHYDTAPKDVVDEHGELWKCAECGYPARFKPTPPPRPAAAPTGSDGANA